MMASQCPRMLTRDDLQAAFVELGELVRAAGQVIDVAVYGGSALMLASNFRVGTEDVDAVVLQDQALIDRFAARIGERRGWPGNWLNDGVRTYLSPHIEGLEEHHALFRSYPSEQQPGLRVFVPSPEYILAMKLMALRLDPAAGKSDLDDILNLLDVVGLTRQDDVVSFVAAFYPEARISARLHLALREIFRRAEHRRAEGQHDAPEYLGRRGLAS